jgi:predicted GTPase
MSQSEFGYLPSFESYYTGSAQRRASGEPPTQEGEPMNASQPQFPHSEGQAAQGEIQDRETTNASQAQAAEVIEKGQSEGRCEHVATEGQTPAQQSPSAEGVQGDQNEGQQMKTESMTSGLDNQDLVSRLGQQMNAGFVPVKTEAQEKENGMADLQKDAASAKQLTDSDAPSPSAESDYPSADSDCLQSSNLEGDAALSRYTPAEVVRTFVEKLLDMFRRKRQFTFLLIGRTGVGKSSIINSLMGEQVAPTDEFEPKTVTVDEYTFEHNGHSFVLIDTPGLCDALPSFKHDRKYMRKIADKLKSKQRDVDCVLYVTPLDETRVRADEQYAIKFLSKCLSEKLRREFWKHAVIVFTFADKVSPADFMNRLNRRKELIQKEIEKYAGKTAQKIPAVPVSNTGRKTPDGREWLGELFTAIVERSSRSGRCFFLSAMSQEVGGANGGKATKNHDRRSQELVPVRPSDDPTHGSNEINQPEPRIVLEEAQRQRVRKALVAGTVGMAAGAVLGTVFGGPIGTAIGAAVGGAFGAFLKWLFS